MPYERWTEQGDGSSATAPLTQCPLLPVSLVSLHAFPIVSLAPTPVAAERCEGMDNAFTGGVLTDSQSRPFTENV